MNNAKNTQSALLLAFVGAVIALAFGLTSLQAEETDDLMDNGTCFDCHLDLEHAGLLEVDAKQVHNPEDGSLKVEAHKEFACIDCHGDIMEIPHKEDVQRTVNCTNCHEETPH